MSKLTVRDITLIAVLAAILFVQEQVLQFLPNIQLTVFLIVLYSKKLGLFKTTIIVFIHVLLDNLVMGSFNILYFPFMLLGWMVIPITLNTVFKKVDNIVVLSTLGIIYSFIYSWMFIIPNAIILEINPIVYLLNDLWFEIVLAMSSFLSIMWLYKPCANLMIFK